MNKSIKLLRTQLNSFTDDNLQFYVHVSPPRTVEREFSSPFFPPVPKKFPNVKLLKGNLAAFVLNGNFPNRQQIISSEATQISKPFNFGLVILWISFKVYSLEILREVRMFSWQTFVVTSRLRNSENGPWVSRDWWADDDPCHLGYKTTQIVVSKPTYSCLQTDLLLLYFVHNLDTEDLHGDAPDTIIFQVLKIV